MINLRYPITEIIISRRVVSWIFQIFMKSTKGMLFRTKAGMLFFFSASNSFMHIFNIIVTYLQSSERISESSSQSIYYQP